jgi:hypothetical protein
MDKTIKHTKSHLCQIPELNLSCIGCCGRIISSKKDVEEALKKNTVEFRSSSDIKKFIWRFEPNKLRQCGICPNLVMDDVRKNKIFCPAHPEKNNDIEHREDYCDTLHLCKTAFLFDLWDKETKKRFIALLKQKIKKKQLDWYSYSLRMDDDSLLIEFEDSKFWSKSDYL